jgi:hypothetical protein
MSWLVVTLKWNTRKCPAHPPLLGSIRCLKTNTTTRVFLFKFITNQDVRICINIHTELSIALANIQHEGFSITHIFIFYPFIISYLVFYSIYFTISYRLSLRNSVTWLCISSKLLFHFCNNLFRIHNNVDRGLSPFIFLFVYPTST